MKNAVLTAVKDLIAQKGLLEKQIQDTEDLVATKTAKMVEFTKNWQHECNHIVYRWLNVFGKPLLPTPYECVLCGARYEHVEKCEGNIYDVILHGDGIKHFERPIEVSKDKLIPEDRKAEVIEKRAQIASFKSAISDLNDKRQKLQIQLDEVIDELHEISVTASAALPNMFPPDIQPSLFDDCYYWD